MLAEWPADYDKPDPATLWKWLERAVAAGLVAQDGAGRRREPYRYWLPGREDALDRDLLPPLPDLPPLDIPGLASLAKRALRRRG